MKKNFATASYIFAVTTLVLIAPLTHAESGATPSAPAENAPTKPDPSNSTAKGPLDELKDDRYTALMQAALDDKADKVAQLLKDGATVDIANNVGTTALFCAAYGDSPACIKLLLEAGADINHLNENWDSIIVATAFKGSLPVMRALIEAGADRKYLQNAINQVKDGENKPVLDYLSGLKDGASSAQAAGKAADNQIRANAGHLPDLDSDAPKPENKPAENSAPNTAALLPLLQQTPFDTDAADTLLRAGADIKTADAQAKTPLMLASASGTVEAVKWLLSKKVEINSVDARGMTALMYGAERTGDEISMSIVGELLGEDADYKLKNKDGKTAHDLATAKKNSGAVMMIEIVAEL